MPDKLKSLAMTEYYLSHHCQRFSVISSIIHNSQRDAQSDASEIQLAFFSHNTCLLEHHIYDSQKQSVYPSCMMGTYCDTSHARDTDFLVYFCRIVLVDGTNWTSGSTETALGTCFGGFRYDTCLGYFPIRSVAWYCRSGKVISSQFIFNLLSKRS